MDFWYKMINSSDKFILDKDFILGTWNKKFDTFSFVKEFIDDINFENLIDEWNKFITATEPLPMGVKYCGCGKCGILMPVNDKNIILYNQLYYCQNCLQKAVELHQGLVIKFLDFINPPQKDNDIEKVKRYYLDYKNCLNVFLKTSKFDIKSTLCEKYNSYNHDFLQSIINNHIGQEPLDNNLIIRRIQADAFNPLWNDFIKAGLAEGHPVGFCVQNACKRCGGGVFCDYTKTYMDYARVKLDPQIICHTCEQWIKILGELRRKYGWNPKWRQALQEFEEHGINSHREMDPEDLYYILLSYDIAMTEDFKNFWNSLYYKYNGDEIVKLYAIPEGPGGRFQQNAGRLAGKISNFLGFK